MFLTQVGIAWPPAFDFGVARLISFKIKRRFVVPCREKIMNGYRGEIIFSCFEFQAFLHCVSVGREPGVYSRVPFESCDINSVSRVKDRW